MTDLVGHNIAFAGFIDGSVLAGRISVEDDRKDFVVKGSSGVPISALAVTQQAWLVTADGCR